MVYRRAHQMACIGMVSIENEASTNAKMKSNA